MLLCCSQGCWSVELAVGYFRVIAAYFTVSPVRSLRPVRLEAPAMSRPATAIERWIIDDGVLAAAARTPLVAASFISTLDISWCAPRYGLTRDGNMKQLFGRESKHSYD